MNMGVCAIFTVKPRPASRPFDCGLAALSPGIDSFCPDNRRSIFNPVGRLCFFRTKNPGSSAVQKMCHCLRAQGSVFIRGNLCQSVAGFEMMNKLFVCFALVARGMVLLALWWSGFPTALADGTASLPVTPVYDYAKPKLLTGTLYAIGSDRRTVLFTFRRTATRSGSVVHVERQFLGTNGAVAAVEKVRYESDRLVSYEMLDYQARVSGAIHIEPDSENPARQDIFISYAHGLDPPKGRARMLQPDTVIDDTLYPFMLAHWDNLMRGQTVDFHFVSLDWERTFEFELVKTGESMRNGQPVVLLTMKPASMFVAALVKPLLFTVQKIAPHRILSYTGRTTPRIRKGKSWKYLDAETVFNYPSE
jgi:hypothetical protein